MRRPLGIFGMPQIARRIFSQHLTVWQKISRA